MEQGKIGIGEVVKQLGVTSKQLHDWEKAGLIESHMTATGREFDEVILPRIEFIRDDLAAQREQGKPTLEKTKEKLQLHSMIVEKKEQEKALKLDTTITSSLEKVLQETGFLEIVKQMGAAYNKVVERLDVVTEELQELRNENRQLREATQVLPGPEQQRLERFNDRMAEIRVKRALRREADQEWAKNPVMKKTGIFGKREEDLTTKDRFIRVYIDEHFEERIKDEYGLE